MLNQCVLKHDFQRRNPESMLIKKFQFILDWVMKLITIDSPQMLKSRTCISLKAI